MMTSLSSDIGALKTPEEDLDDFEDGAVGVVEEEEVMEEASGSSTPNSGSLTWIAWFCSLPGHEYFVEVSEDFIEDDFNLTGLNGMVPFWKEALEMVLDIEPEDSHKIPDVSIVESSAELLYGLVHQRFIVTRAGLQGMYEKYETASFGTCPRVYCHSTPVVPCGRSDLPGLEFVKLYCPNCNDVYTPASSRYQSIDGAFFGTTFPHLFFHTYREVAPAPFYPSSVTRAAFSPGRSPVNTPGAQAPVFVNPNMHGGQKLPSARVYTPKIFGFRVSERARSGPRMRWLRARPETAAELDMVDWRGRWIGADGFDDEEEDDQAMDDQEEEEDGEEEGEEEEEEEEEEEDIAAGPPVPPARGTKIGKRAALAQHDGSSVDGEEDDTDSDSDQTAPMPLHRLPQATIAFDPDDSDESSQSDTGYEEDDEEDDVPAQRLPSPLLGSKATRGTHTPTNFDDSADESADEAGDRPARRRSPVRRAPPLDESVRLSDTDTALDTPVEQAPAPTRPSGKLATMQQHQPAGLLLGQDDRGYTLAGTLLVN